MLTVISNNHHNFLLCKICKICKKPVFTAFLTCICNNFNTLRSLFYLVKNKKGLPLEVLFMSQCVTVNILLTKC